VTVLFLIDGGGPHRRALSAEHDVQPEPDGELHDQPRARWVFPRRRAAGRQVTYPYVFRARAMSVPDRFLVDRGGRRQTDPRARPPDSWS